MAPDIVRDSTFGQIVNALSRGKLCPYPDQRLGYSVPECYLRSASLPEAIDASRAAPSPVPDRANAASCSSSFPSPVDIEKQSPLRLEQGSARHPFLVTWNGDDDPDNPRNWSAHKKVYVTIIISALTFAVYLKNQFEVGSVTASAGVILFVIGYGIGPMFLVPIQDVPAWGRNPVYMVGLSLFVVLQLPAIFANNMATVLAMRFFTGFFGSPALATGGATVGDMWEDKYLTVAIGAWCMGAIAGPVSGPTLSAFATMNLDWTWSFTILTVMSAVIFVVAFFFFPETNGDTILVKRADRLRRLTGNDQLRAPAELEKGLTALNLLRENAIRTAQLCIEPLVLVPSLYIALVYAPFAFPVVFEGIYHFNLGVSTLPYLSFLVTAPIGYVLYCWYQLRYLNPRKERNPHLGPEVYLELGLLASLVVPVSLLLFGWTSRAEIHWIVPIIFISIYLPLLFYSFQSILAFLTMSYPKDAAAALTANDLIRSSIAGVFPLLAGKMYGALGVGGASSLLAGASVLLSFFLWIIKRNGPNLRARSRYATT
ncbi:hypothetical protein JCM8547_007870 [Rhodosporidiobolus lusitaniae]